VKYSDAALEAAVGLSAKHLKDLHLPDKRSTCSTEVGAAQKLLPATPSGVPVIEAGAG
jgi:ATP-dependent Clp protease ATP-binding subunit ClpA